jgi:hypothetical protein
MSEDLKEVVKWLNQMFRSPGPSLLKSRLGYKYERKMLIFRPCVGCAMPNVTVATRL